MLNRFFIALIALIGWVHSSASWAANATSANATLAAPAAPSALQVVATFSILGDIVKQVGKERVNVLTLAGPGQDAHVFQVSPSRVKQVATSAVVVSNGLGFEGWMNRLFQSARYKGKHIVASQGIQALEVREAAHHHGHAHHAHDPHAWQNVQNVIVYVDNISKGLCAVDQASCAFYQKNAAEFTQSLRVLDQDIRTAWAGIDVAKRKVITSHDAFFYYGQAYQVQFLSAQGVSTEAQASAKEVARLITQIKKENTRALFVENISDSRLIAQIAKETGVKTWGKLYSDSLSPASEKASTYIDMMRYNTAAMTQAFLR